MFKTQVGLGVLQLPKAFSILGLIPGIFFLYFLTAVGIWLAFQIGQTPRRHSRVRSLADVGRKVGGRFGEEIFGGAYFLCKSSVDILCFLGS